ncbi:MAG: DUF2178 domain-containing protein [Chloroflexi bacterium]|nr:DUF2178 domain-containing protein [Chloroflexota bacterium]
MTTILRSPVLVAGVVIGLVFGAAALIAGEEAWHALLAAAIPIGYGAVVTLVGRRSDTASVLSGRPIDERAMHLNEEASSWALGITVVVVLAAFVVADAGRGDWAPYAFIAAVMAIAYIGSLLILQARH